MIAIVIEDSLNIYDLEPHQREKKHAIQVIMEMMIDIISSKNKTTADNIYC